MLQVYSECCWHRLQINRLRRLIENTCASSNISLKPSDPSESLFATTPTTPTKHQPVVPLPNSYLHLVIESIIDTLLASSFTSHTKGLDLNNTPFVGQDNLADDEDDEKVNILLTIYCIHILKPLSIIACLNSGIKNIFNS